MNDLSRRRWNRTVFQLRSWAYRLRPRFHRRWKAGRPDLEPGMSSFTPDFGVIDKSQETDRGRISKSFNRHGDL